MFWFFLAFISTITTATVALVEAHIHTYLHIFHFMRLLFPFQKKNSASKTTLILNACDDTPTHKNPMLCPKVGVEKKAKRCTTKLYCNLIYQIHIVFGRTYTLHCVLIRLYFDVYTEQTHSIVLLCITKQRCWLSN